MTSFFREAHHFSLLADHLRKLREHAVYELAEKTVCDMPDGRKTCFVAHDQGLILLPRGNHQPSFMMVQK